MMAQNLGDESRRKQIWIWLLFSGLVLGFNYDVHLGNQHGTLECLLGKESNPVQTISSTFGCGV